MVLGTLLTETTIMTSSLLPALSPSTITIDVEHNNSQLLKMAKELIEDSSIYSSIFTSSYSPPTVKSTTVRSMMKTLKMFNTVSVINTTNTETRAMSTAAMLSIPTKVSQLYVIPISADSSISSHSNYNSQESTLEVSDLEGIF